MTESCGRSDPETRHSCSEVSLCGVPEFLDQRMALECLLHDAALHALAAAVDHPNFTQSGGVSRVDVFVDNGCDILRGEGVKVEGALDRNPVHYAVSSRCRLR